MVDKRFNSLKAVILFAVPAGDTISGQAAFLGLALCPAQIPGAVQIAQRAALIGFLKFTAGLAVSGSTAHSIYAIIGMSPLRNNLSGISYKIIYYILRTPVCTVS